ncbi:MAG: hypothetical protein A2287_07665 [Candidatus Melainabacteria bacterium RIFOXYA12_FULL_32_12]|nr:MAG: hypothetical protein A2104_01010 [Candidatus Melainabacteria bacterium GWF2_32_7]OGI17270.1 MAG: hypothetical protein A2255_07695 [Candidatus Melainabacteria bacterium RIFOXYA2_FULL_32_9]OGI30703.1 MAG: hypothetical protein A2287_07665 [Candidatus Melainabacteria bacterium RIFOXYA12_FULL_32_12]
MRKGFTLLELLIVVVILGILALIAAPTLLNAADQARNGAVKANISAAASSVTSRFALNGTETATQVATNVAASLNTNNKNPITGTGAAYSTTAGAAEGIVTLVGTDATDSIEIKGYGVGGTELITKVINAPQ